MIKLSQMTDHAFVSLGFLGRKSWYSMSVAILSKQACLVLYKVHKLIKLLVLKRDLMRTNRSSPSNYLLNRKHSKIIDLEIIEILNDPITLTSYSDKSEGPYLHGEYCSLDGKWNIIHRFIRKTLISIDKILNYENTYTINHNQVNLIDRIN